MELWEKISSAAWFEGAAVPAIIVLSVAVGLLVRNVLFHWLIRWAERTKWKADDVIIKATRGAFLFWCVLAGLYISLGLSKGSPQVMAFSHKALASLLIVSITLVVIRIITGLVATYSDRVAIALPVTTLTQNVIRLIILLVGGLILLNILGVTITPLLTTLGIGGLAVALALQDTLSNFFSGFYITVAKNIRVGNYIELDTGDKGYVEDIGWRATKIRKIHNNLILVPNAKLAQSIITNYHLPKQELAVLVKVGVDYESDLQEVEKVTCEVAREVMETVAGGVPDFNPFIRYHTFDDFSINFTVILRAKEYVDSYRVKHEFIKRLHARYKKENIVIPFPIRTIHQAKKG